MGNGWFPREDEDCGYDPVDSDGYVTDDYKRHLDYLEQMRYGE